MATERKGRKGLPLNLSIESLGEVGEPTPEQVARVRAFVHEYCLALNYTDEQERRLRQHQEEVALREYLFGRDGDE